MAYAQEFTPELNQNYLASLLNPITDQEETDVGNARREGSAAGLVGQASTGSRIGAALDSAGKRKDSAISHFNLDVANKQQGERLTDEKEAFSATEAQKERDFREHMDALGYEREEARQAGSKHAAEQGQLLGGALSIGGAVVGGYFGGPMGAAAGAAAGKGLAGAVESNEDTSTPDDEDAFDQIGLGQ